MANLERNLSDDVLLRTAGAVLLVICALLTRWLFQGHGPGHGDANACVAILIAMVGFACFSAGLMLTALGVRLFDQVEVSERWARYHGTRIDQRELWQPLPGAENRDIPAKLSG